MTTGTEAFHPRVRETDTLADGRKILLRPICRDDAEAWLAFREHLSWATRYKRGMPSLDDTTPEGVRTATDPDPRIEVALVAVGDNGARIVGVGRLLFREEPAPAEFALVVADGWQRQGIGGRLIRALIDEAGGRGVGELEGHVLATNTGMLDLVRRYGFVVEPVVPGDIVVRIVKRLGR